MKFAHIGPPAAFNMIGQRSYHMALAQDMIMHRAVADFYKGQHANGDFIIVDNGEAEVQSGELEERLPFEAVVGIADYIGADEICMPDRFRDMEGTVEATMDALDLVAPRRRAIIPQGDTLEEWYACLEFLREKVVFRTIMIPKHMERLEGGRHAICEQLQGAGYADIYDVHLLGVWEDPKHEIVHVAQDFPWVRGVDTAAAVAYAQRHAVITTPMGEKVRYREGAPFNDTYAEQNMQILEDWADAHNRGRSGKWGEVRSMFEPTE